MAMELTDFRVFLAVADAGSFSRAASTLVLTQPSVSERIAGLERSVGAPLFERTSRGARLTARGDQLVPYARRCVAIADDALEAVRAEATVPRLRVAVHTTFAYRAVPFVIDALGDLPRRISVRDAHSNEVQEMVLDDAADVGFVVPNAVPRALHREDLPDDEIVCVAGRRHPLARRDRIRTRDLAAALVAVTLWGASRPTCSACSKRPGSRPLRCASSPIRGPPGSSPATTGTSPSSRCRTSPTTWPAATSSGSGSPDCRAGRCRSRWWCGAASIDDPAVARLIGATATARARPRPR